MNRNVAGGVQQIHSAWENLQHAMGVDWAKQHPLIPRIATRSSPFDMNDNDHAEVPHGGGVGLGEQVPNGGGVGLGEQVPNGGGVGLGEKVPHGAFVSSVKLLPSVPFQSTQYEVPNVMDAPHVGGVLSDNISRPSDNLLSIMQQNSSMIQKLLGKPMKTATQSTAYSATNQLPDVVPILNSVVNLNNCIFQALVSVKETMNAVTQELGSVKEIMNEMKSGVNQELGSVKEIMNEMKSGVNQELGSVKETMNDVTQELTEMKTKKEKTNIPIRTQETPTKKRKRMNDDTVETFPLKDRFFRFCKFCGQRNHIRQKSCVNSSCGKTQWRLGTQ
jgi:hypothetical protein